MPQISKKQRLLAKIRTLLASGWISVPAPGDIDGSPKASGTGLLFEYVLGSNCCGGNEQRYDLPEHLVECKTSTVAANGSGGFQPITMFRHEAERLASVDENGNVSEIEVTKKKRLNPFADRYAQLSKHGNTSLTSCTSTKRAGGARYEFEAVPGDGRDLVVREKTREAPAVLAIWNGPELISLANKMYNTAWGKGVCDKDRVQFVWVDLLENFRVGNFVDNVLCNKIKLEFETYSTGLTKTPGVHAWRNRGTKFRADPEHFADLFNFRLSVFPCPGCKDISTYDWSGPFSCHCGHSMSRKDMNELSYTPRLLKKLMRVGAGGVSITCTQARVLIDAAL